MLNEARELFPDIEYIGIGDGDDHGDVSNQSWDSVPEVFEMDMEDEDVLMRSVAFLGDVIRMEGEGEDLNMDDFVDQFGKGGGY